MNKLIFTACDGKAGDIRTLEQSKYWDFCAFLNNFLEKVERHNAEVERFNRENGIKTKAKRPVKSLGGKKK